MRHTRLIWTDEQQRWLGDHIARTDGYRQSTPFKDRAVIYEREVKALRAVQQAVRSEQMPVGMVAVWEWWAYWYSACWVSTVRSPSPQYAQQLEDSMVFRLTILMEREERLASLHQRTTIR
jgi:hypothetical protein